MIDTTQLAEHAGKLKGAVDAHGGLPATHWDTLKDILAGGAPDARDTSEIRVIATELSLYGAKLSEVGRRLMVTVGETDDADVAAATDDEPTASGGMPKKDAYKMAAKDGTLAADGVVATDHRLVAGVLHLPRYMGERQGAQPTAMRAPSWLDKLLPKKG